MPSFKIVGFLVLENKNLKDFVINSHGGHLGHVTLAIYINFRSFIPLILHIKYGFDWSSGY